MPLQQHNIDNNPYPANVDRLILIPCDSDHYKIQAKYSGFVPGAATAFSLYTVVGTNPLEADMVAVADSEIVIDDASGLVIYSNVDAELADFLVLKYVADGNDVDSVFSVTKSVRS